VNWQRGANWIVYGGLISTVFLELLRASHYQNLLVFGSKDRNFRTKLEHFVTFASFWLFLASGFRHCSNTFFIAV